MRAFKVFIFGLLYGWFIKIAFDRIYRENEMEDIRNENRSLRQHIRNLEAQLQSRSLESRSTQPAQLAPPQPQAVEAPVRTSAPAASQKDDLKVIKGVGPAIERKLNSAGIQTFAALAALTKRDLENILGSQVKRLQDENDLIAQAKRLAKKK
ncbi:MAG TPA: helix-hairpin-helix domain-containing protein [Anaerolineales bacterium]|nr:helix-hairpin-helix domain-containing protein [Anaerolineales bacterium]